MADSAHRSESREISRRALLQVGAGAAAGSTLAAVAGPVTSSTAHGFRPGRGVATAGYDRLFRIQPARINAYTGGSPLIPPVLRALQTRTVPVIDPAFVDLYTRTTKLMAKVLSTKNDVILLPAEAIVALEAAFRSVTRPGMTALNLVSGLYGDGYTTWLKTYGANVIEIRVPYNQSIDPSSVSAMLAQHPEVELLTMVHVDTPSGTKNAIDKICPIAKQHGVVTLVDAASTIGGMPVYPDAWGIDIAIGASQKCVGSPLGVGITSVSDDAWALIAKNPDAPADFSFLSLTAWRETWNQGGEVPSDVSQTVTYGLYEALAQLIDRGVQHQFATTALASRAFRAGARAMGMQLWAASEAIASDTNTTLVIPANTTLSAFLDRLINVYSVVCTGTAFTGTPSGNTIRVGHMGVVQTDPEFVLHLLHTLGRAWRGAGATVDIRAGLRAARRVFRG